MPHKIKEIKKKIEKDKMADFAHQMYSVLKRLCKLNHYFKEDLARKPIHHFSVDWLTCE